MMEEDGIIRGDQDVPFDEWIELVESTLVSENNYPLENV